MAERVDAELSLGNLQLHPPHRSLESTYSIEVSSDGTEWGNPEAIVTAVKSLLQDGAIAAVTGQDNRTAALTVRITADTYDGLAAGEAALNAEVNAGRNLLTWRPPSVDAVPTVFDVIWSTMRFGFDDLNENRLERRYELALTCLPFARSAEVTEVPAVPLPADVNNPVRVTVDTCDSTTGWTTQSDGTFGVVDGAIRLDTAETQHAAQLTRTGAVALSATPLIVVDFWTSSGEVLDVYATRAGTDPVRLPLAAVQNLSSGVRQGYWQHNTALGDPDALEFRAGTAGEGGVLLLIGEIARTDSLPIFGTRRQQSLAVEVDGSARTQATLKVERPGGALGVNTVVYTRPGVAELEPPLRRWLSSSSTVTVDSTTVSGGRNDVTAAATVWLIPAGRLAAGTYALLARLKRGSAGASTATWTTIMALPGTNSLIDDSGASGTASLTLSTDWDVYSVARIALPTLEVDADSTLNVALSLQVTGGVELDEAWLFNLDTGALSWVETSWHAGGGDANMSALHIEAPTLDRPRPTYWMTYPSQPELRRSATQRVRAWGTHMFEPGVMSVFVVTDDVNALNTSVSLEFYRRWHTHARA